MLETKGSFVTSASIRPLASARAPVGGREINRLDRLKIETSGGKRADKQKMGSGGLGDGDHFALEVGKSPDRRGFRHEDRLGMR